MLILLFVSSTAFAKHLTIYQSYNDWGFEDDQPFLVKIISEKSKIRSITIEDDKGRALLKVEKEHIEFPSTISFFDMDSEVEQSLRVEVHHLSSSVDYHYSGYMDSPIEKGSEYSLFLDWYMDFQGDHGSEIYLANQNAGEMSISGLLRLVSHEELSN